MSSLRSIEKFNGAELAGYADIYSFPQITQIEPTQISEILFSQSDVHTDNWSPITDHQLSRDSNTHPSPPASYAPSSFHPSPIRFRDTESV
jgi:hypothetical protein